MTQLIVLVVLTLVAVALALVLQRRRPDPPSAPSFRSPAQLDRDDFSAAEPGRFLIVLFSSLTCDTCPRAWSSIESVEAGWAGPDITVQRLDVQNMSDLHVRYRIDGVPTTLIVDPEGVVARAFFGPVTTDELSDALRAATS